ncbi:MAG TPA: tetratricopeptide repeat protein [Polyangia bacterium]|nr:tetratricopeptide repeat protein [Polyangia bacterium]
MSTAALPLVLVVALMSPVLDAKAAPASAPAAASSLAEKLAQLDALHDRRDDPAALASARRLADAVVAEAPADYDVLWRAARVLFTASDEPSAPAAERSRLGKQGYDVALRAIAVSPDRVEGHYWAALSIGSYAEEMGVLHALAAGIEGKFKRPLERATALDVAYDHGNIPAVWAAYYLELPWPKRDRAKAAQYLRQALAINPANLRARLYQARIAVDEHRPDQAKALLAEIAAAPIGRYDPPEERRVKKEAAAMAALHLPR